ncbi:UNVERIFIED_CONTAM: hypothetical protein HDU68_005833 [Siphonaria sp. JEL0065]|nr:hypothetical protein HDU68_005833 [Siphonaria sp. JEL0065]
MDLTSPDFAIEALRNTIFLLFCVFSLHLLLVGPLRGTVRILHANETAHILTFDHSKNKPVKVHLISYLRGKCPSLFSRKARFRPTPLLFNGHLQTAAAGIISKLPYRKPKYNRELLDMPDGGVVAVDWAFPKAVSPTSLSYPIVILFHGLAGGSNETYICEQTFTLLESNYVVAALNYRGSNGLPLKTPQLYAGSYTADVRLIIKHIQKTHSQAPLIGVGYSLGANILLKYIGEEGNQCPLLSAVVVANPFDFNLGINFLHSTFLGRLYSRIMTHELLSIFSQHTHVFPSSSSGTNTVAEGGAPISPTKVMSSKYLTDFDEHLTRRVFGYRTVNEFYRMGGSAQYLPDVCIPTLLLSALDDPVALAKAIPIADVRENPFVILATTDLGGHLGWFESLFGFGKGYKRWFTRPVLEYITAILEAHESLPVHLRSSFIEGHLPKANHVHYKGKHSVVFPLHHSSTGRSPSPTKLHVDAATSTNRPPSPIRAPPSPTAVVVPAKRKSALNTTEKPTRSSFLYRSLLFVYGLTASSNVEGRIARRFILLVLVVGAYLLPQYRKQWNVIAGQVLGPSGRRLIQSDK